MHNVLKRIKKTDLFFLTRFSCEVCWTSRFFWKKNYFKIDLENDLQDHDLILKITFFSNLILILKITFLVI